MLHGKTDIYNGKFLVYVDNEIYIADNIEIETGYCINDFGKSFIKYSKRVRCHLTKSMYGKNIHVDVWLPELNLKFKAYKSDNSKLLISI